MTAIGILTTGGSIDKTYSTVESAFIVAEPTIKQVLDEANVHLDFSVSSLLRKDSLQITEADRRLIREAVVTSPHRHMVITHGTDTMVETARALAGIPDKVIVLTGAMRPAAFRQTDAAFNIGSAIIAVQTLPEGVHIVMNGRVFDPLRASKNLAMDRFEETPSL
jgi:L-asparaginase